MRTFLLSLVTLSGLLASPVSADFLGQFPTTEAYLDFLFDRPFQGDSASIESDWTDGVAGITHDEDDWYITQSRTIFRVPVDARLDQALRTHGHVQYRQLEELGTLDGYVHFGDPSYYSHDGQGVVLIPVDEGPPGEPALLAIVRADETLAEVNTVPFPGQAPSGGDGSGQAGFVMVDPDGRVYSATNGGECLDGSFSCLRVYEGNWDQLGTSAFRLTPAATPEIALRDPLGNRMLVQSFQGGDITASGRVAYLSAGWRCDTANPGLHAFDLTTGRQLARSGQSKDDRFMFKFSCGQPHGEEPQGLTIWDLDDVANPANIRGQLHVLLLDNQADTDNVYFKHYSGRLFVDSNWISGDGSYQKPFPRLDQALDAAWSGARIRVRRGAVQTWTSGTIETPIELTTRPGTVTTVNP